MIVVDGGTTADWIHVFEGECTEAENGFEVFLREMDVLVSGGGTMHARVGRYKACILARTLGVSGCRGLSRGGREGGTEGPTGSMN